jgi:hypothetical protein
MNEPRPGLPGPKVSFASHRRWGTEPEGWYVDLPYAVFLVGVNYSPLGCAESNRGAKFMSIAILRTLEARIFPIVLAATSRNRPLSKRRSER